VREFRGTNWYYWRQRFSLDDTASYDCVSGYRRTGDASLAECTRSGWTPNPLCEAPGTSCLVECGRPPPLADADIQGSLKSKYSHNEKVVYTCQQYYVMEGRPHRTCSNGKWTGDLRCLKPCTVTDEAMRQRNIAFRYTYEKKLYASHNDEIEFMCTGRTTHVGTVTMHPTCIDGEIQLPTCH
uniref:Sushi domain-containing protein n=1 Tax=Monopterus albus TaxID=43700 RepID=A0A3Q3KQB6_MONAL